MAFDAGGITTLVAPPYQIQRPHTPTQEYCKRLPSPPRINVPPPLLDMHGLPDLSIAEGSIDFDSSGFANAEFLKRVTHGNVITHNNMLVSRFPILFLSLLRRASCSRQRNEYGGLKSYHKYDEGHRRPGRR